MKISGGSSRLLEMRRTRSKNRPSLTFSRHFRRSFLTFFLPGQSFANPSSVELRMEGPEAAVGGGVERDARASVRAEEKGRNRRQKTTLERPTTSSARWLAGSQRSFSWSGAPQAAPHPCHFSSSSCPEGPSSSSSAYRTRTFQRWPRRASLVAGAAKQLGWKPFLRSSYPAPGAKVHFPPGPGGRDDEDGGQGHEGGRRKRGGFSQIRLFVLAGHRSLEENHLWDPEGISR